MFFLSTSKSYSRRSAGVLLLVGVVAGVTVGGGVGVFAASSTKSVTVCANKKTNVLRYAKNGKCTTTETKVLLNQTGADGISGAAGAKGDTGAAGAKGDTGAAGAKGDTGAAGAKGEAGTNGTNGQNLYATLANGVDLPLLGLNGSNATVKLNDLIVSVDLLSGYVNGTAYFSYYAARTDPTSCDQSTGIVSVESGSQPSRQHTWSYPVAPYLSKVDSSPTPRTLVYRQDNDYAENTSTCTELIVADRFALGDTFYNLVPVAIDPSLMASGLDAQLKYPITITNK